MKTYAIRTIHGDKTYLSNVEANNKDEALHKAKEAFLKRLGVKMSVEPDHTFEGIFDRFHKMFNP